MAEQAPQGWLSDASEATYSEIDESRHHVVFPWLVEEITKRNPASVLDYGAGDGRFLDALRRSFAGELHHFEPSAFLRSRAAERLESRRVAFLADPEAMPPGSVEVVVSTAVWMTIASHDGCVTYLRSQARLLKEGGTALVTVTHPCFREERFSSFRTSFRNEQYLNDGAPFEAVVHDHEKSVTFVDYHWSLSAMAEQALAAGFRIAGCRELPDAGTPGGGRGAPWLCLVLEKPSRRPGG